MIVYLDQNKWIELAKIYNKKIVSPRAVSFLKEIEASIDCGYNYPLSAIHYMEFSRISNPGRKKRLGQVMWKYSQGKTLISSREIIQNEIESSLSQFFPNIKPKKLKLIGSGIANAFGELRKDLPFGLNEAAEEAMLTGDENFDIDPISFYSDTHRLKIRSFLESLHEMKHQLHKNQWDNWLYAITIKDILEPLNDVMISYGVNNNGFGGFDANQLKLFVETMPTRQLDVHLLRQVLKNPNYKPKDSDLEDWSGLGIAACYCDVVVCEKHFADMLKRDKFKTKARVVTNLYEIFNNVI